jgi:hypothetical protein
VWGSQQQGVHCGKELIDYKMGLCGGARYLNNIKRGLPNDFYTNHRFFVQHTIYTRLFLRLAGIDVTGLDQTRPVRPSSAHNGLSYRHPVAG